MFMHVLNTGLRNNNKRCMEFSLLPNSSLLFIPHSVSLDPSHLALRRLRLISLIYPVKLFFALSQYILCFPLCSSEHKMSGSVYVIGRNVKSSSVGQLHVCQSLPVWLCIRPTSAPFFPCKNSSGPLGSLYPITTP